MIYVIAVLLVIVIVLMVPIMLLLDRNTKTYPGEFIQSITFENYGYELGQRGCTSIVPTGIPNEYQITVNSVRYVLKSSGMIWIEYRTPLNKPEEPEEPKAELPTYH